ncbi:MAG: hypothetical protein ACR2PL_09750 [Dehalococcoidia bacterium]
MPWHVRPAEDPFSRFLTLRYSRCRSGHLVDMHYPDAHEPLRSHYHVETMEKQHVAPFETERDTEQRTITWSFTAYDARTKLRRLYPMPQPKMDKQIQYCIGASKSDVFD